MSSLVSVIVPVYNGSKFIIETLESVRSQTYRSLECIVVDDGSTDDTGTVVKDWIASDSRFSYIYQPNKGLSGARNTGLDHAKGTYIQFLDADDILLPAKIERQIGDTADPNPTTAAPIDPDPMLVSYTDYSSGSSADIFLPAQFYKPAQILSADPLGELITRWESLLVIPPHCFLFSAAFFREKGIRFDTSLPNHEDFDCWLTIFRLQPVLRYVDEKLCIYRITDGSMSKKVRLMGEGFLQVLDKQLTWPGQTPAITRTLKRKRREVLKRYNRFDIMTFKEKILLFSYITAYYRRRILQKTKLIR